MASPYQNLQLLKSTMHCPNMISTSLIPNKKALLINPSFAIRPKCPTATACINNVRPKYIPNKISDPSYVRILDTTLRDGEQTPGINFSSEQKLEIACQLTRLGVDVIEAGFPASSPMAAEAVKQIAATVGDGIDEDGEGHVPAINVVARCVKADIDVAWEAVRDAKHPRIGLFIATSDIHMKYKLMKSKDEVLTIMKDAVLYARSLGLNDLSFCAEDSSRTEKEFLYKVFEEAIKSGATTLIISDTVGCMLPHEWGRLTADVMENVRGIENVVLATHCHDDLGLATANTLAAVKGGARHVEGTINGIGERAGNAALEEVIMAIKCRGQDFRTGINTKLLSSTSQMVEEYSGVALQPNKPIVGANIFSHASGIHQDGVLKHRGTYEMLSPEDIGKSVSNDLRIVLGKHSGRHALRSKVRQLGYDLDDGKFEKLFLQFKEMSQHKKLFSDSDVTSLVEEV